MRFPFIRVPELDGRPADAFLDVLELSRGEVRPALSVQPAWNRGQGIRRGLRRNGELLEDHIVETVDSAGKLQPRGPDEPLLVGSTAIRSQVWTVEEHRQHFAQRHSATVQTASRLCASAGNGNLLSNPGFVAYDAQGSGPPVLYRLASEPIEERTYSSLVAWNDEASPGIEELTYSEAEGITRVALGGRDVTERVTMATSGQRLVHNGSALTTKQLVEMAVAGWFYDLRHLLRFGRVGRGPERWIDIGLAVFRDEQGTLVEKRVREAVTVALGGEAAPIEVDVSSFDEQEAVDALEAKGYWRTDQPTRRGEFSLVDGCLRIGFLLGVYAHSLVGLRANGELFAVAIHGFSNRSGMTLRGAAETMLELGAVEALLIDNGADVTLDVGEAATAGDKRLRSMLLFHAPDEKGLELTRYDEKA